MQTLQMHNDGLEIYQKPKPVTDAFSLGDDKSVFKEDLLDDDFEMGSDEEEDAMTDFQGVSQP